ncbi:Ig-like domain-containing protein [Cellulosimicrobium sp. Marseille-Q4280]|uniref:Ig-like domain-containing protein n=1 Tax=Cellulosimicrobium sp. Marseille-Q4280 TaxID=2937992 RepID=UPI00203D3B83|nr:Ig-like domain-containing protein [Cellulosimicrobium sp. Marseille-Q4280]
MGPRDQQERTTEHPDDRRRRRRKIALAFLVGAAVVAPLTSWVLASQAAPQPVAAEPVAPAPSPSQSEDQPGHAAPSTTPAPAAPETDQVPETDPAPDPAPETDRGRHRPAVDRPTAPGSGGAPATRPAGQPAASDPGPATGEQPVTPVGPRPEPAEPAEPPQPVEPPQPTDPPGTVDPGEPGEPGTPSEPEPGEPVEPVDPGEPAVVIESVDDVEVDTLTGIAPALPDTVTVHYSDGTTAPAHVTWDPVDPALLDHPRQFELGGTLENSGVRARAIVTVNAPFIPVDDLTLTPPAASVLVGTPQRLTAVVTPANATNRTVSWATSDPATATVSPDGVITGLRQGDVQVTATTVDGAREARTSVEVLHVVSAPELAEQIKIDMDVQPRCLSGNAYLAVWATNAWDEPVDVTLSTPYGRRTALAVRPGANAYQSFAARTKTMPAGYITVERTLIRDGTPVTEIRMLPYDEVAC